MFICSAFADVDICVTAYYTAYIWSVWNLLNRLLKCVEYFLKRTKKAAFF